MNRAVYKMDMRAKVAILSALSSTAITTLMTQALVPTLRETIKGIIFGTKPEVTITSPRSFERIPRQVLVQGIARHIPKGKELWILVEAGGHFFPQESPIRATANGAWIAQAFVGLPEQVGVEFGLIAALADQTGSAAIRANLAPKTYPPLDNLAGIEFMCQVRVIRG